MTGNMAAMTMVRDDPFFLRAWVRHYGGLFGRENLYVINHGRSEGVAAVAAGCNLIGIPDGDARNFDRVRWGLLNGLLAGIGGYYQHVIIGDVDELVVLDPAVGPNLAHWLAGVPRGQVLTPLGIEVIHHPETETAPVEDHILGPRRFVRPSMIYSKPCVISTDAKLARGGHYASYDKLNVPEGLYMVHLKYCDFQVYVDTVDARNRVAATAAVPVKKASIGRHWFSEYRGDDRAVFEGLSKLPLVEGFEMAGYRQAMQTSFRPRAETGFYQFDLTDPGVQHTLPERFFGLI